MQCTEANRELNWGKHVAADSHINHSLLTSEQREQQRGNKRKEIFKMKSANRKLEKRISALEEKVASREAMFVNTDIVVEDTRAKDFAETADTVVDLESTKFIDEVTSKTKHVLENWEGTYAEAVENTISALLEHGVDNEKTRGKKAKNYKFEKEDSKALVNFIREQISNQVKVLCDKKSAVSFSVDTYQWTNALCSSSKSRYRHLKASAPFIVPSVSSQEKVKTENRVPDGRNTKVYETRGIAMLVQAVEIAYCYIMTDEVQIKKASNGTHSPGSSLGSRMI